MNSALSVTLFFQDFFVSLLFSDLLHEKNSCYTKIRMKGPFFGPKIHNFELFFSYSALKIFLPDESY